MIINTAIQGVPATYHSNCLLKGRCEVFVFKLIKTRSHHGVNSMVSLILAIGYDKKRKIFLGVLLVPTKLDILVIPPWLDGGPVRLQSVS